MYGGLPIFFTDRDGLITQAEFYGKALAKSFSLRNVDPNHNGLIGWPEYNISFDILDTDNDELITTAEFNCAPHAAYELLVTDRYGKFAREIDADPDIFDTDGDSYSNGAEINETVPKARSC